MKEQKRCECCGAKMVEYKHSLNSGLAIALNKLVKHGKPATLKELGLAINQFNNFQKLQYWGLVDKNEDNEWYATRTAGRFFEGYQIPKSVWTYRGKFVRAGDEQITIGELRIEYRKKLDYVKDERAVK